MHECCDRPAHNINDKNVKILYIINMVAIKVMFKVELASYHQGDRRSFRVVKPCETRLRTAWRRCGAVKRTRSALLLFRITYVRIL